MFIFDIFSSRASFIITSAIMLSATIPTAIWCKYRHMDFHGGSVCFLIFIGITLMFGGIKYNYHNVRFINAGLDAFSVKIIRFGQVSISIVIYLFIVAVLFEVI